MKKTKEEIAEQIEEQTFSLTNTQSITNTIRFLVNRKFPGSDAPPPPSTLYSTPDPGHLELYEERREERKNYRAELNAMSREKLQELHQAESNLWANEKQQEDNKMFFNRPGAKIDYDYWCKADLWTTEEGIAIYFGRNPAIVNWERIRSFRNEYQFVKDYMLLRDLVMRALTAGVLRTPTTPVAFIA